MRSLTVAEARTRAASLAVVSYDLELDLTRGDTQFRSKSTIEFDSRDRQDTWVDVRPADLLACYLNGRPIDDADFTDGRLLLRGLSDTNVLVVEANMLYSHDGEGLHRAVDPEDKQVYVYAMTFLDAAPRVFACFDQPDLKAPFLVGVTAPSDWTVIGNGRATQVAPGNWKLAETKPLATYFVTLVAGPYHSITAEHDGIHLGLHCRQTLAPHLDKDADELFTSTGQAFDEYHRLFGIRYPFGDYHQVFCPEFNAGAMENPGCVTIDDNLVFKAQATDMRRAQRADVVTHEMAHQWFGDLVTMTWWDDLWLNESFADYMGYRVTHDVTKFKEIWSEFAYLRKAWGMAADQRRSTHPIAGNGVSDTASALTDFDGISYCKGAASLRQLNAYLGEEAFLAGVVDHLNTHAYGNARLADLVDSWSRAGDTDVHAWAEAWLRTSGVDTLTCRVIDGQPRIERTNGSPTDVARPHAITVTWFGDGGRTESTDLLLADSTVEVPLPSYDGTGVIVPDSGDETWAKIVLDDASRASLGDSLPTIPDKMARAVVWSSLRETLLDGELDPAEYIDVIEGALPHESDIGVDGVLNAMIGRFGRFYTDPALLLRLNGVAAAILASSEPATNRQLVAARAVIASTDDEALLRRWLDGGVPGGVTFDEDMRWRLVCGLCEQGVFGEDEIESELGRDPSSQGAIHALACRASIPDVASKERVWQAIVTDASLTNYEVYALAGSFFRPAQNAITAPYVARFFTEVPETAAFRSTFMVERHVQVGYPEPAVTEQTVALAEACLARSGLNPVVRRGVSDSTDDLRRALRSRERYRR